MDISIVAKESFHAVGLTWTGTYVQAGAGEIRQLIALFQQCQSEIEHRLEPLYITGISYDQVADGFSYFLCTPVSEVGTIPEGMELRSYPAQLFVTAYLPQGTAVEQAYRELHQWLEQHGYQQAQDTLTYMEKYAHDYDLDEVAPAMTIMIPVHPKEGSA